MSATFLVTLELEDTSPENKDLVAQEILDLVQENYEVESVEPWSSPNLGTMPQQPSV